MYFGFRDDAIKYLRDLGFEYSQSVGWRKTVSPTEVRIASVDKDYHGTWTIAFYNRKV